MLEKKAERMDATNVAQEASAQNADEISGNSGNISTSEAVQQVEALVEEKGVSERKAVEIVAEETGKNPGSLRVAVSREKACDSTTHFLRYS